MERKNKRVFEDKKRNIWVVIDSIICEVGLWLMVKKDFKELSLNEFVRDWVTCISISSASKRVKVLELSPSEVGKVKINFDGASFGNLGLVGV